MNINLFFIFVSIGLAAILFLFKPLEQRDTIATTTPLMELNNFKLTELDAQGLTNILNGTIGLKYENHYILEKLSYIDSTDQYIINIEAKNATYKGDTLSLEGDVGYFREDGMAFQTQRAEYNKITKIVNSSEKYTSSLGEHEMLGSSLIYNTKLGRVSSKDVEINYKLKERENEN